MILPMDCHADTGELAVWPKDGTIPATAPRHGGWAIYETLQAAYIADAGAAVPSNAVNIGGWCFTNDGALYTTQDATTGPFTYIRGFKTRQDGALVIASRTGVPGTDPYLAGWAANGPTGAALVGGLSAGPGFIAPLKTTVVPLVGVGSATYSRATTATVTDWEAVVRPVLSGEVRFQGARRVYNRLTFSQDLSNAAWAKSAGGTGTTAVATANFATAPDGTMTASRLQLALNGGSTTADQSFAAQNSSASLDRTGSVWLKANSGAPVVQWRVGQATVAVTLNTATWVRYSITRTSADVDATVWIALRGANGTSDSADILVWGGQLENVTGQSNTNPSEYVSVGVLSTPFHGAAVDGVKYFDTQNGNTVASNVVTENTGNALNLSGGFVTNLLLRSEELDNASWAKTRASVTANAIVAPDGSTTADKVVEDGTAGNSHVVSQLVTLLGATAYTTSMYLKAGERTWARLGWNDGAGNQAAWFNLSAGTVGTQEAGVAGSIQALPNGWYRCTVTITSDAVPAAPIVFICPAPADNTATYNGDGVSGIYVWGAQLEQASSVGNYTKTTTTQASSQPLYGYLAEGARTNLCLQSEDQSSATWVKTRATITSNSVVAPDGVTTADTLVEDATAASTHFTHQIVNLTAATAYTWSCWAKTGPGSKRWLVFNTDLTNVAFEQTFIDLTTGTISQQAAGLTSASVRAYPNGYYFIQVTGTARATAGIVFQYMLANTGSGAGITYNGDAVSGNYVWGSDIEVASFASSYIPTTTASVPRNADFLTYPSVGNIDPARGSSYAELGLIGLQAVAQFALDHTDAAGRLMYRAVGEDGTRISAFDGTAVANKTGLTDMLTAPRKRASSWGSSGQRLTGDGAAPASTTFDGSMGVATAIGVGVNPLTGSEWFGTIRNVMIWQTQKSDAILQTLTT